MYSKGDNLYVMFVDMKSYIEGMLTHYQQEQALVNQDR